MSDPKTPKEMAAPTSQALIDDLVAELKPVRALWRPGRAATAFSFTTLALMAIAVLLVVGHRGVTGFGFFEVLSYLVSETGLCAAGAFFAFAAACERVPGRSGSREARTALVFALSFWALAGLLLVMLARHSVNGIRFSDQIHAAAEGWACTVTVLGLALLGGGAGWWFMRRGATTRPLMAAFAISGLVVSLAAFVLPLACENGEATHLLISHMAVPIFIVAAIAAAFGSRLFRW